MTVEVVRFCSRYPNARGAHVGVFGLVNVLGRHGMLTPDEERLAETPDHRPRPRGLRGPFQVVAVPWDAG